MSVRGCHAPVFDARGRQKRAAGHRPTVRRWVKNDDSGTLGFLKAKRSPNDRAAFFELRFVPYRPEREGPPAGGR